MFKFRLLNIIAQDLQDTQHRRRFFTFCDFAIVTTSFGCAAAGGLWGARLFTGGLGVVPLGLVGLVVGFLAAYLTFDSVFRLFSYLVRHGWLTIPPSPNNALQRTEAGGVASSDLDA